MTHNTPRYPTTFLIKIFNLTNENLFIKVNKLPSFFFYHTIGWLWVSISSFIVDLNPWNFQHSLNGLLFLISFSKSWTCLRQFLRAIFGGYRRLGLSYSNFANQESYIMTWLHGSSFTMKGPTDTKSKISAFIAIKLSVFIYFGFYI